jgi:hypothetical protein
VAGRGVKFADGLRPGEGSSPEHDDERVSSPPPLHSALTYDRDSPHTSGAEDDEEGGSSGWEWETDDEGSQDAPTGKGRKGKKPWEVDEDKGESPDVNTPDAEVRVQKKTCSFCCWSRSRLVVTMDN